MLSKHNSSSGRPASDSMLVTAAARIGAIRKSRSSMPKIANELPAATNNRSPVMPCAPMVLSASTPITQSPSTMVSAPATRREGKASLSTIRARIRPPTAAHDGWMMAPWPSGTNT